MESIGVFIDGAYLDKVLVEEFHNFRLDYEKFVNWLAGGRNIFRVYYYNCLPYLSEHPTEEERKRYSNKYNFFSRLGYLPRFHVRLGELEYRGQKTDGSPIYVQKRVDLLMGIDLALMSGKNCITEAVIFTGDSDFVPAVQMAQEQGVLITLGHGSRSLPHEDLRHQVDEDKVLNYEIIGSLSRK